MTSWNKFSDKAAHVKTRKTSCEEVREWNSMSKIAACFEWFSTAVNNNCCQKRQTPSWHWIFSPFKTQKECRNKLCYNVADGIRFIIRCAFIELSSRISFVIVASLLLRLCLFNIRRLSNYCHCWMRNYRDRNFTQIIWRHVSKPREPNKIAHEISETHSRILFEWTVKCY